MIDAGSTLIDVASEACDALNRAGIVAILCGGSAAAYYSSAYQSLDADFVLRFETRGRDIDAALSVIGFVRGRSNIYAHSAVPFTVEFPAGPLSIGRKLVTTWRTVRHREHVLHVISPEDCVSDRFLHFWAWRDKSARNVALQVAAAASELRIDVIDSWAAQEIAHDDFYDAAVWRTFRADLLIAIASERNPPPNK